MKVPIPVDMISDEAVYLGAATASMALSHLRMLLYNLENLGKSDYDMNGSHHEVPSILLVENKATVAMSKNYKPTKKNRHIARRFHYVRGGENINLHKIIWIPAEDQLADDLTKTQPSQFSQPHVDRSMFKLPLDLL